MSETLEKLRNVAIVGHSASGKTSLAEALLFNAGVTSRLGRVDEGNAVMDFEPEELKRKISISTSFHQLNWRKHPVHLMDTPGDQNFFSDTKTSMQAADGVIIVVDAVDGVKVQTEQAFEFAREYGQPCMIFINKLDRERSDFEKTFNEIKEIFEPKPIIVQLPIGTAENFKGIADLTSNKAFNYESGGKGVAGDIPPEMESEVENEREAFVENVAEADDELIEKYLEEGELSEEELTAALRNGIKQRLFIPVLCGCALENIGADLLMDFVVKYMPSPLDRGAWACIDPNTGEDTVREPDSQAPFSGFVFKTVADPYAGRLSIIRVISGTLPGDGNFYNVNKETRERYSQLMRPAGKEQKPVPEAGPGEICAMAKLKETTTGDSICVENSKVRFKAAEPLQTIISYAVEAKNKGEEDKVFTSLSRLMEEDLSLTLTRNTETKEILLSGLGQIHIESTVDKLKRKYNVEVELKEPKVPYKETIKKKVRVQGKHKKQSGGHGQYGDCWIQLEPLERGSGFEFVDAIVGGAIPKQYIPAVEKGIQEAAEKGILAGFPCIDFKVTLDDGTFHAVDSSEMAFKVAGSLAFKKGAEQANPVLMEPIMEITIITPEEYMGDIMGDLNGKRGRVLGMEAKGKNQVIRAMVPMAEFLTYAPDLRSMTGGRGMFTLQFSHYDEVPAQISQKIIDELKSASG